MDRSPHRDPRQQVVLRVRHAGLDGSWAGTVDDPALVQALPHKDFHHEGLALVEAVVAPNAPPLPRKITTDQTWQFAKALAKVQTDRWDIVKTVVEHKIREGYECRGCEP